jgi:hypothetical protein
MSLLIERIQYKVTIRRVVTVRKQARAWQKTDDPKGIGPKGEQYAYAEPQDVFSEEA